jgi:hypothetical protein
MAVAFGAVVLVATVALIVVALTFIKLIARLILLPLLLIKFVVGAILTLIVGPLLFVVGLMLAAVLFVPLLPFVILGALVWLMVRPTRRPAVA